MEDPFLQVTVAERLARVDGALRDAALIRSLRPRRRPVRVRLGLALMALGRRLAGCGGGLDGPPTLAGAPSRHPPP
jgi:hypothetical protein